jgi:RNA polymerase sigma-70 factor (ECF subfamily)
MTPDRNPATIESLLAQSRWLDALARRLVTDPHEADDIVQETWIAALKHPPPASVPARSWLARVARNFAIQRGRGESARRKREESVARHESTAGDSAAIDRAQTHRRLVDAVLVLEEPYRSTVVLHYFDHLPIVDIAVRQSTPESTVRTRLSRAISMLRARFQHEDGDAWSAAFLPLFAKTHHVPLTPATSSTSLSTTTVIGGIAVATAWKIGASVAAAALVTWWMWPSHTPLAVDLGAVAPSESPKEPLAATGSDAQQPRLALSATAPATPSSTPSQPLADTHALASLDVHVRWGDDGTPASGIMVGLWQVGAPDPFTNRREGRTDEHGHVHFDGVFVGKVGVSGDRGGDAMVSVSAEKPSVADITIPDGMDVEGTVVDDHGEPVPDARIWISNYFNQTDGHEVERSDANGRYHLRDVGEARYLAALHDRYGPSEQHLLERHPTGAHVELPLVLIRSARVIAGTVLDEVGRPVAGARVELRPGQRSAADECGRESWVTFPPVHRITDAAGAFEAADMGDGMVRVTVRAVGFAPADAFASEQPDQRGPIIVKLKRQASMHGFIRNADGTPADDVLVACGDYGGVMGSQTWTRADGSYRLEQLSALRNQVHVDARGGGEERRNFDLTAGADVEWNVTLRPNASVKGSVTDAEAKPLAGWLVMAKTSGDVNAKIQSAYTAEDGSFTVGNWPNGADTLEVREPDTLLGEAAVLVRGVEAGDENVKVTVHPGDMRSAFITGRVLDTAGQPLADTQVIWSSALTHQGMMVPTNDAGRFRVGPLRAGAYELEVDVKGQARKQVHDIHLAPKQELDVGDVQLERSGALVVRVHFPPGVPAETFMPSLTIHHIDSKDDPESMSLKDYEGRLAGLLPGDYLVSFEGDAVRVRTRANVVIDQTTTIDVETEAATSRSVQFILPAGTAPTTLVKIRLFDPAGEDVYGRDLAVPVETPVYFGGLVVGTYRLEARMGDGPITHFPFDISSLSPSTEIIQLRL